MVDSGTMHLLKSANEHHQNSLAYHSWHGHGLSPSDSPQNSLFRRQGSARGSIRKMLPPVPDMETQMSLSAKMIDKRTCTPKGNHSYSPFFLEYSLLAEYNLLQKQKLPGIYVIPSYNDSLKWYGIIFVRQGQYQGGIFRFTVIIPQNFPDGDCPRLVFDHHVFHPAIDPVTHELDVLRGFHKWKRNVNHIWQILLYSRRIFYKIDTKNPFNQEAADLFESGDKDGYKKRVSVCVSDWSKRIYDSNGNDDPHFLNFSQFNPETHGEFRHAMNKIKDKESIEGKSSHNSNNNNKFSSSVSAITSGVKGLSFMEPGTLNIFARNHPHAPS